MLDSAQNGTGSADRFDASVVNALDGSVFLAGQSDVDFSIVKLASNGSFQWQWQVSVIGSSLCRGVGAKYWTSCPRAGHRVAERWAFYSLFGQTRQMRLEDVCFKRLAPLPWDLAEPTVFIPAFIAHLW